jgi:16S rRNA processing protein RimM
LTGKAEGPERIVLARITKPWGLRGSVAASIDTDGASRFVGDPDLVLEPLEPSGGPAPIRVTEARDTGPRRAVLKIEGFDSIEAAEKLRGGRITIPRPPAGVLPRSKEGEYSAFELIGTRVELENGEIVGMVEEILETGGADLLVVRGDGRERLIPFARAICRTIEPENGRIVIAPPEGLLDLDRER